jgi:hypothetical protein
VFSQSDTDTGPFVQSGSHSDSKTCNQPLFHPPMSKNLIEEIPLILARCEIVLPVQQALPMLSFKLLLWDFPSFRGPAKFSLYAPFWISLRHHSSN